MLTCHIDSQYLMERSSFLLSCPDPSLFFPLSPPTFDHDFLHELLVTTSHHHLLPTSASASANPPPLDDHHPSANQTISTTAPTKGFGGTRVKRSHRKDRHSKIVTAQGPRDRRMRLSLDVARKFFDLQDTLGFDKASKTVDWLLTKSETAIKDLTRCFRRKRRGCNSSSAKSASSTSECEVVSLGLDDSVFAAGIAATGEDINPPPKPKIVTASPLRKPVAHPTLVKKLRILARARARERTREKKIWRPQQQLASSSSHFETTIEESAATQDMKSSVELMAHEVEQPIPPHSPNPCQRTSAHERADETLSLMAMNIIPGLMSLSDFDQNFIHNGDNLIFLQEQWNMLLS